ncbi:MAG: hypothetical protein WD670_06540, partial [Actinomycetota bacterium]
LALTGGALNPVHSGPLYRFLEPAVASIDGLGFTPAGGLAEGTLIAIASLAGVVGIALAYVTYVRRDVSQGRMSEPIRGPLAELAERRFFVDDLYETVFVRVGSQVARAFVWIDTRVIDGAVNAAGAVSVAVGSAGRRTQSGLVRSYVGGMALGALALVAFLLVQVR